MNKIRNPFKKQSEPTPIATPIEPPVVDKVEQETKIEEELEVLEEQGIREDASFLSNWWNHVLVEGIFTVEGATKLLPFFLYLAVLGLLYIGSHHFVARNVREIDRLTKEVKELSWDYKTLKADLMLKSTLSNVSKRVDTLGLKEAVEIPNQLVVKKTE